MRSPDREGSDLMFAVACLIGLIRRDLKERSDRSVEDQLDLGRKTGQERGRDRLVPKQVRAIMKDVDSFFRQI